jgi:AcrR family transcriptional regulator
VTIIDDIVQAALAEFSEVGIRRTSVDDVARRAGLGRATVYRHGGGKDRLVQLVIEAEIRRGTAELDDALRGLDDPADIIEAAFAFLVRYVRGHPMFDRVLHREPELLIPALTVDGGPILASYRSLIAVRLRAMKDRGRIDPIDIDRAAEALARLAMSLVLTPSGVVDVDDHEAVAAFARETLLPILRPTSA